MKVKQAIECATEIFRSAGNLTPSHCDVRCAINDLIADNPEYDSAGYNQDRAWQVVRRKLGNPVKT